jgi:hypothetical protein
MDPRAHAILYLPSTIDLTFIDPLLNTTAYWLSRRDPARFWFLKRVFGIKFERLCTTRYRLLLDYWVTQNEQPREIQLGFLFAIAKGWVQFWPNALTAPRFYPKPWHKLRGRKRKRDEE